MDNIYNSASFCGVLYNHLKKVVYHDNTIKGMRGVHDIVIQQEVKSEKKHVEACGIIKATILEGDYKCPNLIASTFYDTKSVQSLSMVTEELN